MGITTRWILRDELDWANQQYKNIGFLPSVWSKDKVALATDGNQKLGIGRLGHLSDGNVELGGIYVLPKHRNKGVASAIISFLVENSKAFEKVYCLPFEHLKFCYEKFGFMEIKDNKTLPSDITKKHAWCLNTYDNNVLVMVKSNSERV